MPDKAKALLLFSGGLDSMLAARILKEQDIEVAALTFESNFFNADLSRSSAKELGIPLLAADLSGPLLELVKNPPHGYGKNLNPCIDCHSLMVKTAGRIIRREKAALDLIKEGRPGRYDFIATGEVLGQRPFSQTRQALRQVESIAGQEVLRPLSAKLMAPTLIEQKGLVQRHKLHSIEGRGRDRQLELARKYKIKNVPMPAGGCLLTDKIFSESLGKILDYWPSCGINDVELLKNGRIFWLKQDQQGQKALLVVARDQKEGENLKKLAVKGDFVVELRHVSGPTALLRSYGKINLPAEKVMIPEKKSEAALSVFDPERTLKLIGYFAPKARGSVQDFIITVRQ